MELTSLTRILAFSAILALGTRQGESKPVLPVKSSLPDAYRPEDGKGGQSSAGGLQKPEKSQKQASHSATMPKSGPEQPSGLPAKEERTDCDDCVIVHNGAGKASGGLLAGTLWGLFMVRRPRGAPRAIIRGITVS